MDLFGLWLLTGGALGTGFMIGGFMKNDNKKSSN